MNDVRAGSQAKRRRTRTKANPPTQKRPRCGRERTSPRRSSRTTAAELCTGAPSWLRTWLSSVCEQLRRRTATGRLARLDCRCARACNPDRGRGRERGRRRASHGSRPPVDRRVPGPGPASARYDPLAAAALPARRRRNGFRRVTGAAASSPTRAREQVSWFSQGVGVVTVCAGRLWRPGRPGSDTPVGRRHDSAGPGSPACAAWPASRRCARRALRHARWPGA